jgi:tRNA pseudouridine13 synthase
MQNAVRTPDVGDAGSYLTPGFAPIRAAIKRRYEDFIVEEVPAYEPEGAGDHTYFTIEKTGLATLRAVNDIARALGVESREIGVAGLKDARAIAIQTLSVEHVDPERVKALQVPRIRILKVSLHHNKLKIGHLRGNRFKIRLRDVDYKRLPDLQAICDIVHKRGVPNFFGRQRFGLRGDTWQMGRAILQQDYKELIDLMLGRAGPYDVGEVQRARQLYDEGKFVEASKAWPYGFGANARGCRVMAQTHGNPKRAFFALDLRSKKFFVNAYQSYLFNLVLARRIAEIDIIKTGDLAYKHDNGSVFHVEDGSVEQPRATAFEISATGPILGMKMSQPTGEALLLEESVIAQAGAKIEDFSRLRGMKFHGARRPLRFKPEDLTVKPANDHHGSYVELEFFLPSGCYATMLLREICKDQLEEGLEEVD